MRNGYKGLLLTSVALLVTVPAYGQEVPPAADPEQPATEAEKGSAGVAPSNAIVVTARRKNESLQDVPQTVNVVTAESIEKLRINTAADIAQIVPGLSIEGASSGSGGFGSSSGIRGVTTFLNSNASPVVQFYLNDAPTGRGPEATQSLFDIGQIEVLKGPQGTLRGRSAPTGSITITSRRPDLDEVGGFLNMSGSHRGNINVQGALGVPIITDVLAFRVAAVVDHGEGNAVTSANFNADPYVRQEAVRGTLRFEPTDAIEATLMYQRLKRSTRSFSQVFGPGNGLPSFAAGLNGPAIAPGDRLGITDAPNENDSTVDFLVGQASWSFAGQKLSYVGSYRKSKSTGQAPLDNANALPGIEFFQTTFTPATETSHELRLSSEERVAGIFDYVVGAFYDKEVSHPTVSRVARFLTGAFGPPGTLNVQQPLDRYTLNTFIDIDPKAIEKSVFANVTAHIGENTELSAGGRFIDFKRSDRFTLNLLPGFNALNNPTANLPAAFRRTCENLGGLSPQLAGAITSTVYPGRCELPIAGQVIQSVNPGNEPLAGRKFTPFLYNISLSHKFSPDFMVFGNVGTAFRSAGPAIGLQGLLDCCTQAGGPNLGSIRDLVFHGQEKSKTYEIGFKSSFFDRRARLNVSLFRQKFDNYFFLTQSTEYLVVTDPATAATTATIGASEFTTDADAKVKGIDIEASFQVTPRWSVNLGYTWSKARLDDALIPCNDSDFNGAPDRRDPAVVTDAILRSRFIANGTLIGRCRSSESISRTPRWNLTAQSEYSLPISDRTDGFLRGNFVYYPDNPNSSQGVVIDKYSLLNMYAGLRDSENAWEVSLFANNLLNTQQILSINPTLPSSAGNVGATFGRPANVGYQTISYTPRREFGLLVRYAFGSR